MKKSRNFVLSSELSEIYHGMHTFHLLVISWILILSTYTIHDSFCFFDDHLHMFTYISWPPFRCARPPPLHWSQKIILPQVQTPEKSILICLIKLPSTKTIYGFKDRCGVSRYDKEVRKTGSGQDYSGGWKVLIDVVRKHGISSC